MNKYIPKVGEVFEYKTSGGWKKQPEVVFETEKQIAFIGLQGFIILLSKENNFRPIQKKSDVEREQLVDILRKDYMLAEGKVEFIQEAGFTIPKKIKRSDIENTILAKFCNSHVIRCYLVTAICELLGDLVEQDEKGGAE
jgi:5-formaminoimidazole-4-carboxamide-1-beta-D-ribofuranosyl 5'-monophosphate synthetase